MPLQSDRVAAKAATIVLAIAAMMLAAPGSRADDVAAYPNQPIRVVIGFSTGSSVDVSARVIGEKLAETWKHDQKAEKREIDDQIYKYVGVAGIDTPRIVQVGIAAAHIVAPK